MEKTNMNKENDNRYYIVNSLMMANALTFITGQMPYVFESRFCEGKKVWSFVNDDNFKKALTKLTELQREFKHK